MLTKNHNDICAYKGNIIWSSQLGKLQSIEKGYIIVQDNNIKGVFSYLPAQYNNITLKDFGNKLIIPGFVDLHLHAPQFANRGMGMDKELLQWLEKYTFPEEGKFSSLDYAKTIYKELIKEIWKQGITRSVIFSSIHKNSTRLLLDYFIKAGLGAYIGKVAMDRNCPDYLIQPTEVILEETEEIIIAYNNKSNLVKPIITPRFIPTCTPSLLKKLGELAYKYNIPIQSHISENFREIEWVKNLHPEFENYAEIYNHYGCFGQVPTVMAHCIYNTEEEIDLMNKNGVYAAHCPDANYNLANGIMPARKFLDKDVKVGLGTDIGAGHKLSIKDTMVSAIQASKLKWLKSNKTLKWLTIEEAFYLGTKGGGSFFGKVGSFEEGFEFDALIIDDTPLGTTNISLKERLERFIYIGDDRNITHRFVGGKDISKPNF